MLLSKKKKKRPKYIDAIENINMNIYKYNK